jgi:hypothetical protein
MQQHLKSMAPQGEKGPQAANNREWTALVFADRCSLGMDTPNTTPTLPQSNYVNRVFQHPWQYGQQSAQRCRSDCSVSMKWNMIHCQGQSQQQQCSFLIKWSELLKEVRSLEFNLSWNHQLVSQNHRLLDSTGILRPMKCASHMMHPKFRKPEWFPQGHMGEEVRGREGTQFAIQPVILIAMLPPNTAGRMPHSTLRVVPKQQAPGLRGKRPGLDSWLSY